MTLPKKLLCEECLISPSKGTYLQFFSYEMITIFFRFFSWWLIYQVFFQVLGFDVQITNEYLKFIFPKN